MKRFRWGVDHSYSIGWRVRLNRQWYDGPFWELEFGRVWAVWNLSGLPKIFQED